MIKYMYMYIYICVCVQIHIRSGQSGPRVPASLARLRSLLCSPQKRGSRHVRVVFLPWNISNIRGAGTQVAMSAEVCTYVKASGSKLAA